MSIRLLSCGPLREKICPDYGPLRRRRGPVEQSHTSPRRGWLICVLHATATPSTCSQAQHDDAQLISRFGYPLYCSLFALRAALPPPPPPPFSHDERNSCRFGFSV